MDEVLINRALEIEGKLVYKKLKNRYRIYCMKCRKYEYVSNEMFRQIQASRICPMCYQEIVPSKLLEHRIHKYITDEGFNGYLVEIQFIFGRKLKSWITEVLHYLGKETVETRYIVRNMGFSLAFCPEKDQWKVRKHAASGYMWMFYDFLPYSSPIGSKKEYIYKALFDRGITNTEADKMVKSNQKKIFQDYLLSGRQMEYVIAFDLKSYKDVLKYRTYMRKNEADPKKVLNVYYLDYLYRNKINLRDFYDYMKQCEELGFKLDKPKDFYHRHQVLTDLIIQKRNEEAERKVKARYAELLKMAYTEGDVQILPFKDSDEIRKCGKRLHNCIGTYVRSYSKGETDIYYLKKKNKVMVAIEVENKELVQARADHNKKCPSGLMRHIKKWCSMNQFAIGEV